MNARAARTAAATGTSRLLTRPMLLLLVASVGGMGGFYLLLSVLPLYAATAGGGGVGAGLTTGAMMLATVLAEPAVPWFLARFGHRAVVGAGLLLLGLPSAVLSLWSSFPLTLGVCLARGVGLGIVVVAGTALAAELAPPGRRSENLGLYGVSLGVPSVLGLPAGVWLSDRLGFEPVFLLTAALTLLALPAVAGLPARRATRATRAERLSGDPDGRNGEPGGRNGEPGGRSEDPGVRKGTPDGPLGAAVNRSLVRPTLILGAATFASGVLVTFLPLALLGGPSHLAVVALLVQASVAPLARWGAGWWGDRHGSSSLLLPAVLAVALGTAGLVRLESPVMVIVSMVLFGAGFGAVQNVTLATMFERVPRSGFGRVSVVWNLAFDAGMGLGAVGFGLLIDRTGYPWGFAVTAVLLLAVLGPAWHDRRYVRAETA
ncbi:MFS transporter [Streptomyces cyaneofuscatus]|uniref:MFS transporter n=1 Tax=Streptomyces cyaneofuscatus TaxID=66883 RepID=UPI0029545B86|nr:MFS transporter [Streptomyces cyaneofuscatus]WOP12800.1 MFS transporter [Streptomyces cyaneofuscatus]